MRTGPPLKHKVARKANKSEKENVLKEQCGWLQITVNE
ncbi:hypothetical protein [Bacillus cereus]